MPTSFPCPNPACTYHFPAEAASGFSLTCPRCGAVIELRPGSEKPSPGKATVAGAGPAVSRPVGGTLPGNSNSNDLTFALDAHVPPVPETRRVQPVRLLKGVILILTLLVILASAIGIWIASPKSVRDVAAKVGDVIRVPTANCQLIMPSVAWEEDESGIRSKLKALLVMRRRKPRAWLALVVKELKGAPIDATGLRNEVLRRLGNYFNQENLESELAADGSVGGLRAQRLVFHGEVDGVGASGECWAFTHQGLAYWLITWARTTDVSPTLNKEFDGIRQQFGFLK